MGVSDPEPVCILVVEDEILIRMASADMLIEAGYAVIEANSADQAIALLEAASNVQLLFSDIQMPGSIDGLELAALVTARWPAIFILLTSGNCSVDEAELPQNSRFIPKPYYSGTVIKNVNELLSMH